MVLKALGYLLAFLGKGTWLKSVVLKERLTIPDYLLHHPVWIHLVVPTTNWESNRSPLSVAYDHQATTPSVCLLGSRLAARLAHGRVLGLYTYRLGVSETQVLEFLLWRISAVFRMVCPNPLEMPHPADAPTSCSRAQLNLCIAATQPHPAKGVQAIAVRVILPCALLVA